MEQPLFRKQSMERVSSPEQLSDYLHVTSPAIWIVLAAVILLLASLFVWSSVTAIESYAAGEAEVHGGVLTLQFDDGAKASRVEVGMNVKVGELTAPILSVGSDENGNLIAIAIEVSPWALTAMQWAVQTGLITGMTETTLSPKAQATRAQVATILMRFDNLINE